MKGVIGWVLLGLFLVLASGLVMAAKTPFPELMVSYDRATDSPLFASWDGSTSAGVGFTSNTMGDKTSYQVKLFTVYGISSKFWVKANEYIEDGAKVRAYKITTMKYGGKTTKEKVKKLQVSSFNHYIIQRYIDVPTQEVAIEIRYDDDKEKSVVFKRINGALQKTGTYNGLATLAMHTDEGSIKAMIIPPVNE